jgi:hypothetical protein
MKVRGGESQRSNMRFSLGYSAKAHCTGKPAYLKPNSNTMQIPIGGRSLKAPQFPEVLENRLTKNFLTSSATTTTTANDSKKTQSPTPSAVVPKNSCINGT